MQSDNHTVPVSKTALWTGLIMSALVALTLLMSGVGKLAKPEAVVQGFRDLGWDDGLALGLGILEIACAAVYVFPRTAVLGAILLTGYFGGAIATHVRIGEQFIAPVILGLLVWGGLYLRDARLRALLPLRR
jgi:DoxX-like family